MARRKKSLVFIDTHVALWMFVAVMQKLSRKAAHALEDNDIRISPIVRLELQYLYEIKRVKFAPSEIILYLQDAIELKETNTTTLDLVNTATDIGWTRDPFDRLIVAEAQLHKASLVTKDKLIRKHYDRAIW